MSPNSQPSTVTALLIIGLIIVATALIAVYALICARSSAEYSSQHRTSSSITANFLRTRNRRRHLIRFDDGSPLCALGNDFGRSGLPGSDLFPEPLSISPSHPTTSIFGGAKDGEGLVKFVLTPPTPARRGRRASLVDQDNEDRI